MGGGVIPCPYAVSPVSDIWLDYTPGVASRKIMGSLWSMHTPAEPWQQSDNSRMSHASCVNQARLCV
jgi:hypothetical protein